MPVPAFPSEGGSPEPEPGGAPAAPAPAPGTEPPAAAAPPPAPGGTGGTGGGQPSGEGGGDRASVGGNAAPAALRLPLRVYNNSRIEGLAARAADDFRRGGWEVTEVGAYGQGIIPVTTVYYRPGTDEEATARALGEQFGLRVNPRFEGLEAASPGIIVIVTREYAQR
ncbi:hypothetical protein BJF78_02965 [Pseudonocardia sp. CNS-139]|nr:hypothetical protein BJF78_02965 [Pseudonocardia sp. CNS-139]